MLLRANFYYRISSQNFLSVAKLVSGCRVLFFFFWKQANSTSKLIHSSKYTRNTQAVLLRQARTQAMNNCILNVSSVRYSMRITVFILSVILTLCTPNYTPSCKHRNRFCGFILVSFQLLTYRNKTI